MDISAPSPISAQATAAAHNALRAPADVTKVTPSTNVSDTRADPHTENGHGQSDRAAEARQVIANRERLRDPSTPTGPSPTFQITLLEVEQDLQNILARIEANRAKDRDAQALQPAPVDVDATAEADADRDSGPPSDPSTLSATKSAPLEDSPDRRADNTTASTATDQGANTD